MHLYFPLTCTQLSCERQIRRFPLFYPSAWFGLFVIYCGCLCEVLVTNPDSITPAPGTLSRLAAINEEKTVRRGPVAQGEWNGKITVNTKWKKEIMKREGEERRRVTNRALYKMAHFESACRVVTLMLPLTEEPRGQGPPRGNTFQHTSTWRWAFCMLQGCRWCLPQWKLSGCGSPDPPRVCPSPEPPEKRWDSVSVRLHPDPAFGPLGLSQSLRGQRLEVKWRIKAHWTWEHRKRLF